MLIYPSRRTGELDDGCFAVRDPFSEALCNLSRRLIVTFLRQFSDVDFVVTDLDPNIELELCVSISPVNGKTDNIELDKEQSNSPFRERGEPSSFSPRDDIGNSSESSKDVEDDRGKSVQFSLKDIVKRGETFQNKSKLKAALEMSAMKNNFDYKVVKSDRNFGTSDAWTISMQMLQSGFAVSFKDTGVPEDSWVVPDNVWNANVLAPESRRGAGRRRKRRYETAEDKIRSSQGAQEKKRRKCTRCGEENHNMATCDRAI
ncbi:hypothetical protein F2Q70_00004294 [Brassica cretica]|uniref:Uncharacterized protein n=1 Tax=Brassica cretica TaxID=69181 RepID=A0A8S9IVE9_BRACR|nr:hypothetical protein F2Q70_00004294 [Brassica cretica]